MEKLPDFPNDTELIVKFGLPFVQKGKFSFAINPGFFAAKFKKENDIRHYDMTEGDGWFQWNGRQWLPLIENDILEKIEQIIRMEMASCDIALHDKVDAVLPLVYKSVLRRLHNGCVPVTDPNTIPFKNMLAQWEPEKQNFVFRPYTHDDAIFSTLDVEYIPNCSSELFEQKICEILPYEDDRCLVQQYMGASLFSENRTRKFLLLQGEGGCGKSLLVNLLIGILGRSRVFDLNFDSIRQNYEFASLESQTLLTASEAVSHAFCQSSGVEFVKKAVGGDHFETKQKFRNKKIMHSGFYSLIIVSNNSLHFQYDGRGDEFKDRLLPIRFERHIDSGKQDKELLGKLLKESPAILNWLLEGARIVRKNEWNIELSPEQISRRDRIIEASKGIELFVKNHVVLSAGCSFTTAEAYTMYLQLQQREGFEYLEEQTFQKRIARAMNAIRNAVPVNTLKGGKARGYRGFALA